MCAKILKYTRDGRNAPQPLGGAFIALDCWKPGVKSLILPCTSTSVRPHPDTSCLKQTQTAFPPGVSKRCYCWRRSLSQKKKKKKRVTFQFPHIPATTDNTGASALASKSQWKTRQRYRDPRSTANTHARAILVKHNTAELCKTLSVIINHNPIFWPLLLTKKTPLNACRGNVCCAVFHTTLSSGDKMRNY